MIWNRNKMSKVSYLISTYNSAAYLDRCIRDLMLQDDQDFEIIIINPNSPDSDDRIAKQWVKRDDRILYTFVEERETYGRSWLRAWKMASSPYVANANTDDKRSSKFGWRLVDVLDKNSNAAFAYPGLIVVDENDMITGGGCRQPFDREIMKREFHCGPSFMWRRDLLKEIGLQEAWLRADIYHTAFDYWLVLKFMSLGYDGVAVPDPLVYYTQRKDSIEHQADGLSTFQSLCCIAEFFPEVLRDISQREKNNLAVQFETFPLVPEPNSFCEALKKQQSWYGVKINILEL